MGENRKALGKMHVGKREATVLGRDPKCKGLMIKQNSERIYYEIKVGGSVHRLPKRVGI